MTNVGVLHLLLIFVVALSGLKRLHGVSADYAPEKMDLDNEARLEMNLEPRSSIPHPKNSAPVTPAATLYVPSSEDGSGIEGSNNHEEEKKDQDSNNEEIKQTTSTNNTAAPENTPAITSPFTNAPNASSSNGNSTSYFPFQPANQNTSSTEVSPPESVQNPADDLNTSNENDKAKQQTNVSNLTTNTEETVSVESISFGTPSKPLTPIKSEQEVEDKADDTKTAKHHKNKPTAAAFNRPATTPTPITTAAKHQDKNKDNKSKMEDDNESDLDLESGSGTDDQDRPEGPNYTPSAQQGKQSASTNVSRDSDNDDNRDSNDDSSHDSKNAASFDSNNDASRDSNNDTSRYGNNDASRNSNNDASRDSNNDASHDSNDASRDSNNDASHDSNNDASHDSNNDVSHDSSNDVNQNSNNDDSRVNDANDSNDDDDYEEADDDLEDDSGSGHDENEPFLHDNHTLTSTRGSLKVEAKKRPIVEENAIADKDTEKAVEDAIDQETDYEDNDTEEDKNNIEDERKENQVDKPKPTQLSQKFEKEDGNLNETGTNKSTETKPKADKTLSKTHLSKKEHNKVKGVKKTSTEKDSKKVKHVKPEKKEKNGAEQHRIFNQPQPKAYKPLFKYIKKANLHLKTPKAKKTPEPTCNSEDIKTGFSLKGGTRAGHVDDLGESAGIRECIKRCCRKDVCDVALLLDGRCFGVSCFTKDLCQPVPIPHPHYVASQIAFLKQAQRRTEVGRLRPELDCKYGELTIRNKHRWTGELCGGVLACKNGIIHLEKCPGIPPKPKNCANPKLYIKQRPGRCCIKKWLCKDKSCMYGVRKIPHGVSLSDPLCTGIISCYNGHLKTTQCPGIPTKPENCANPRLKITSIPGKCCRRKWVCQDKGCTYNKLKVDHGERLTDASCAVVMECNNGFLNFKQCPSTPVIPHGCINPKLKVKRVLGECCHMKWACAPEI